MPATIHGFDGIAAVAEGNSCPSNTCVIRNLELYIQDWLVVSAISESCFAQSERHSVHDENIGHPDVPTASDHHPQIDLLAGGEDAPVALDLVFRARRLGRVVGALHRLPAIGGDDLSGHPTAI